MRLPISSVILAAASIFFASYNARADSNTGLEIIVRPGYGSAGDTSPVQYTGSVASGNYLYQTGSVYTGKASPYGGGFVGDVAIGYRFSRFVSIGIAGGLRYASHSTVDDGTTNLKRSAWNAGPYLRIYFPTFYGFEAYVGAGFGYMSDVQKYNYLVGTAATPAAWTLTHYGAQIPLNVGIDYRFLRYFGVGPSFQYTPVIPIAGCQQSNATGYSGSKYCSTDSSPVTTAKYYGVWSIGLSVRGTFF